MKQKNITTARNNNKEQYISKKHAGGERATKQQARTQPTTSKIQIMIPNQ
jgi:hypothetical protein